MANSLPPGAVQKPGIFSFLRRHGVNDGLDSLERRVHQYPLTNGFAHAGDHAHQVFHVTHFLDLLDLGHESH